MTTVLILLCVIGGFHFSLCEISSTVSPCPGICTSEEVPCNDTVADTDCDAEFKCCLDGMEITTVDKEEIDETFIDTEKATEYLNTETNFQSVSEASTDATTENSFEYATCPGVCIPTKHASLCRYEIRSKALCGEDKTCCASKDELNQHELASTTKPDDSENYCPGKCVHPSLTIFCEKIIEGQCPMNSKCCAGTVAADSVISPLTPLKCSGTCLPVKTSYLCVPPFNLIPGTDCEETLVCCTEAAVPSTEDSFSIADSDADISPVEHEGAFASDESGRIFHVYPNGEIRPLELLSEEEKVSPEYTHFADIQVEAGTASLFQDSLGTLYQLASVYEQDQYESDPDVEDMTHTDLEGPEQFLETVSLPDDSDDFEQNTRDVILPDVGEELLTPDHQIPTGERTMVKPKCPGKCISSLMRLTCIRNYAVNDGFTCPSRSVCCASLSDIERHQQYLKSLSPYFTTSAEINPQEKKICGVKKSYDKSSRDANIGEWCWQAAVINNHNQYVCGGAIIDQNWILTAAHCVTGPLRQNQALYVRAGVTDLSSAEDSVVGQTRRAFAVYVHHNHNSVSLDHDIALVRLQSPFTFNDKVCSICLSTTALSTSNECMVTGYGFVNKVGRMSLRLHQTLAPLVDDMDCISNITEALNTLFILPDSSFCAGSHMPDTESCQGDAGGPLVCMNNGRYELAGLVSWGLSCGDIYVPNIYVKVPTFISWINQIMNTSTFLKALSD